MKFVRKFLMVLYWILLIGCFLSWFNMALMVAGLDSLAYLDKINDFLIFIFDTKFGGYFFYSAIFIEPVAFIIVSISRRKISFWEVCVIAATWCLIFYAFPRLRG